MPTVFAAIEGAVRDQIRAHVREAWPGAKVGDDIPEAETPPGNLAAVPEAYVHLSEARPSDPDSDEGGMRQESVDLAYEIVARFAKPPAGPGGAAPAASLHDLKRAKLDALRQRLTSGVSYQVGGAGGPRYNRRWLGDMLIAPDPETRDREAGQNWYAVRTTFVVTITVPLV